MLQALRSVREQLLFPIPAGFDPLGHDTCAEDLNALVELGGQTPLGNCAVEIGSWAGLSTLALARSFLRVFAVDTWEGNSGDGMEEYARLVTPKEAFQTFCKNMPPHTLFRSICPLVGHSRTYAEIWHFLLDMVFIDADHARCAEDIQLWKPWVKPGGILAVHDYGVFDGVTKAVDELLPGKEVAGRTVAWARV